MTNKRSTLVVDVVFKEEHQRNYTTDRDRLQGNNQYDIWDMGSLLCLDEVSLAELAYEGYTMILDSISPKIQESVKVEQNENEEDKEMRQEIESGPFFEYLDELCSDEDFVRDVELILDTDYLDSLLSTDPEPSDLLALEKRQEMTFQEHQHSADVNISPLMDMIQQQLSCRLPANFNCITTLTEEILLATLLVEEPALLPRAQAPILDPPGSQSDTNPNYDGLLRNIGPTEDWTRCSPLLTSISLDEPLPTDNPVNATSPLYPNGSLMDCIISSLRLLADTCPNTSLASDFEARDNYALVIELAPTEDESKDASASLPNLGNAQSAQTSQKLQEGPLSENSLAFESRSTSSDSGSKKDPRTTVLKDPAPSFRADSLAATSPKSAGCPALNVPALKAPLEEQCCPQNINSCLEAIPVPADSSFVADSYADPCDIPVDGDSSALAPGKLTVEPPKDLQVSKVLASSELGAGQQGETEQKDIAMQKQTVTKAREEETTNMTFERKEESKDNKTNLKGMIKTRRSQRLSGIEKARLIGEFTTERVEEKKPSKRSAKKTAKNTPESLYEKQRRRSSGERQLFKREESNFEERGHATKTAAEQFSDIGEKEHQELSGEMQKLKVEEGEQSEAKNPRVSTDTRAENDALTHIPQEEKKLSEGERNKEGMQMSSFLRRKTRSMTTKEKVLPLPAAKGEIKSLRRRKESDTDSPTLLVSSPMKRSRNRGDTKDSKEKAYDVNNTNSSGCKTNENKVFLPESSLQSPKVQTDSHPTKESPEEGSLDDTRESPSVKTCEKIPNLTLALSPEARQIKVRGSETWDFYSSRSQNGLRRTEHNRTLNQKSEASEVTDQPSNPKATAEMKDEGRNGEGARRLSVMSTPVKRYIGVNDEGMTRAKETVETGTEMLSLSPMKRSRKRRDKEKSREKTDNASDTNSPGCKSNKDQVSLPESSQQSPKVQTGTCSTGKSRDERSKSPFVKTCKKNPNSTFDLNSETQQQNKTVALNGSGAYRRCGEVTGTETWDFYSLRSQNVSKRTVNSKKGIQESEAAEETQQPSNPKATADVKDERINGEGAKCLSLLSTPMKRYKHEGVASEERETGVKEAETSPMKRGRWKSREEVDTEREEGQKMTSKKKSREHPRDKDEAQDKAETSKPSPPSTRSSTRASDGKISNVSVGQESFKEDESSKIETRTNRKKAHSLHFPRRRPTQLSKKLPTKCKDFISGKTNTNTRQLDKRNGKVGRGRSKVKKVC
ncbi:hypothetical protein ABVT39_001918 [Epinephelus coioides]